MTIYLIRTDYIEKMTPERFFKVIDEELAKGNHIETVRDKLFPENTFMVCYW